MSSVKKGTMVNCPVCEKPFTEKSINKHVNECLGSTDGDDKEVVVTNTKKRKSDESSSSGKSSWGFLMSGKNAAHDQTNSAKRCKVAIHISPDKTDRTKVNGKQSGTICIDDDEEQIKSNQTRITSVKENMEAKSTDSHSISKKSKNTVKNELNQTCSINLSVPLAEQMRPAVFEEYIGQEKALGKNKLLTKLLQSDSVPSMILWGPPGCGKVSFM